MRIGGHETDGQTIISSHSDARKLIQLNRNLEDRVTSLWLLIMCNPTMRDASFSITILPLQASTAFVRFSTTSRIDEHRTESD